MQESWRAFRTLILFLFLAFCVVLIFYYSQRLSGKYLTFAMLDVGQGDALYIESPTGRQVLVDAGPPKKVLSRLSRLMPLFDRSLDAIIITNPDSDHIAGFLDVLKVYKVREMLEAGTFNDSETYKNLKEKIKDKNIHETLARQGMHMDLGGGAYLDILFPDHDVSDWTTNDGSVVALLTYGETSVMLTGDATTETERLVLSEVDAKALDVDILKVGHHGSRTSTSDEFVTALTPTYAFISSDGGKKYGHPHRETLETLSRHGVKILRTDELGTIIMRSDGKTETFSFKK